MWNSNSLEDEIQRNILEYGMSVNTDRSIPDAKSGLKPVAKRILWDAFIEGRLNNKPHVKNARIVGDTMGRFHPHGDSSIYGALIRLSQDWVMRYPLIDIHGSNGNIMGDGPAAMRYTEGRLTKLSEEGLLAGIKKKNVDFIPNYDETEEEPKTLPAIFPNLLCNPNEGIGWAMACSWAPHNLKEVAAAIEEYLEGKEPMIPGPDFPTGGLIINGNDLPAIVKSGHGSVKIRGKYNIEKQNIVFYELPYGTRLEALMSEIGEASNKGDIANIIDVRNESSTKKGIRLVIEIAKGVAPESVIGNLFAKTNLQASFSYNQVALVDGTPTDMTLKDAIKVYVDHNINCICKEAKFDLDKAEARLHIVEGLIKALEDIDNIIALIKKSESAATAKSSLMEKYSFTEIQAKAILDMKLAKLAKLEKVELENEAKELMDIINDLKALLQSKEKQIVELKKRLSAIVLKYGDDRRTEITHIEVPKTKAEKEIVEVVPEDIVISVSQTGLIKRVPKMSFKVQKRAGKGVKSTDDTILDVIKTNTVDTLMFFTTVGKMYRLIANKIPETVDKSKGTLINDLVKLEPNEKLMAVSSLHRKSTPKYIIFITKNGMIKKSYLSEYTQSARSGGLAAIKLKEGDEIASILFQDEEDIIMVSEKGMCIRIATNSITPVGRTAMGVAGMKLNDGDRVVKAMSVHKETDTIATFCSNGLGKKTSLSEITITGRNTKGVNLQKLEAEATVTDAALISDEDNILICGKSNSICISASDIPLSGRSTLGNILIKGNIKSITKI